MAYRVVITPPAKRRLNQYICYTAMTLKNVSAAKNIKADAKATKERLSKMANIIKLCDNPTLASYGYRKIKFRNYDFVMLYRIEGNYVIVEGMFHNMQDYENIFISELHLY